MKRIVLFLLAVALVMGLPVSAGAASLTVPATVSVGIFDAAASQYRPSQVQLAALRFDGEPMQSDMPPFIYQTRTMIPVRLIAEKLSAEVLWMAQNNQVIILKENRTIVLTIGSSTAQVNGAPVSLPNGVSVGLAKYNGAERVMVPLRFVSEQLGAEVDWDNDSFTASVVSPSAAAYQITDIAADAAAGTVTVATSGTPSCNILDYGSRVVVDFLDGELKYGSPGSVTLDNAVVSGVRYSQYDQNYEGHAHVARVVVDLKDGMTYADNIKIDQSGTGVVIRAILPGEIPESSPLPLDPSVDYSKRTVVLDAGHGGSDCGANYGGIYEKNINLAVTQKVYSLLQDTGINLLMTRTSDATVNLYDRPALANNAGADLFMSIHSNASATSTTVQGIYTCYYGDSSTGGKQLAQSVQSAVIAAAGATDRGLQARPNLVVLKDSKMPAALIEMGFMSTPEELARLTDDGYQQELALGIAGGIIAYLNAAAAA